jgi:hypothetical protein
MLAGMPALEQGFVDSFQSSEMSISGGEVAGPEAVVGGAPQSSGELRVLELAQLASQVLLVAAAEVQAGLAIAHHLAGGTGVGHDAGNPVGGRFQHDEAEGFVPQGGKTRARAWRR